MFPFVFCCQGGDAQGPQEEDDASESNELSRQELSRRLRSALHELETLRRFQGLKEAQAAQVAREEAYVEAAAEMESLFKKVNSAFSFSLFSQQGVSGGRSGHSDPLGCCEGVGRDFGT